MKVLLILLYITLASNQALSQLCKDSLRYILLDTSIFNSSINLEIKRVLADLRLAKTPEESLIFYNNNNEIFRFEFNNNGVISGGEFILWLYEMIDTKGIGEIETEALRSYRIKLKQKELNKLKLLNFVKLLELADTSLFKKNTVTYIIDNVPVTVHQGNYGIIYNSIHCKVEYFEKDPFLALFYKDLRTKLRVNTKRRRILKNLRFKYFSFGGCGYTSYKCLERSQSRNFDLKD